MDEMKLPTELVDFLKSGHQLEYDGKLCEPDRITLLAIDDLQLSDLWVTTENTILMYTDPHLGINGSYAVPAVNLVADCTAYNPFGILVWLPKQQVFGSFDGDHGRLYVFPGIDWTTIVSNPVPFINCQWRPWKLKRRTLSPGTIVSSETTGTVADRDRIVETKQASRGCPGCWLAVSRSA